jgi:hypothetical protein
MLFAQQDVPATWITAVTAIAITIGLVCQIVLQIMTRLEARRAAQAAQDNARKAQIATDKAASAVAQVKTTLVNTTDAANDKLDGLASVAAATHTLVNNKMGIELLAVKELSQWKADREPTPENKLAAKRAQVAYDDHMTKQASVDANTQTERDRKS